GSAYPGCGRHYAQAVHLAFLIHETARIWTLPHCLDKVPIKGIAIAAQERKDHTFEATGVLSTWLGCAVGCRVAAATSLYPVKISRAPDPAGDSVSAGRRLRCHRPPV